MSDVQVRVMEPDEREAVKRLHRECFPEAMALDEVVLETLFQHRQAVNLVADRFGVPIGYAGAVHGARPRAKLLTIHVHPDARGNGIGSALMDELETRLRARKARHLELEVHADNDVAQAMYRSRGYEVVREDPEAYPSLEDSAGLVMRKALAETSPDPRETA